MQDFLNRLSALVPSELDWIGIGKFILILVLGIFAVGFVLKKTVGKDSLLNKSICAGIGILFLYGLSIVVYSFNPTGLARLLSRLPYVIFSGDKLYLFVFKGTNLSTICSQALGMLILSFLYHLMDDFLPRGKGGYWLLYRVLTILISIALHFVCVWAINTFLTGPLLSHAPTVVMVILGAFFLLGALKLLLGVVLTIANPIIGGIYAFFFSNKIGRQLTRALLTTLLLSILVMVLQSLGYGVVSATASAFIAYIPVMLILLGLWYAFSHLF